MFPGFYRVSVSWTCIFLLSINVPTFQGAQEMFQELPHMYVAPHELNWLNIALFLLKRFSHFHPLNLQMHVICDTFVSPKSRFQNASNWGVPEWSGLKCRKWRNFLENLLERICTVTNIEPWLTKLTTDLVRIWFVTAEVVSEAL